MFRIWQTFAQASLWRATPALCGGKVHIYMESKGNELKRRTSAGSWTSNKSRLRDVASSSSPSLNSSHSGRTFLATTTYSSVKPASKIREEEQEALSQDQVRQDKVWREFVEAERRATKHWYQNWSFLKDYDPLVQQKAENLSRIVKNALGKKKEPEQLPEDVSVFSDKIPNTTGHVIGSRMNTDRGKTLAKMDYFLNYGKRKKKLGQELQPS